MATLGALTATADTTAWLHCHKGALLYVGNVKMCHTMLPMVSHISRLLFGWFNVFLPEVTPHTHGTMVKPGTLAQLAA